MTVGELIRALSYWSPDTPVELAGEGELGVSYTNPDFTLEYETVKPDTLYIVEEL